MNDTYDTLAELVDASTTDRELELIAAAATAVAAPQLLADLRDVRDQERAAVRPKTMTDEELIVQSVLDLGVADLITYRTTDAEIDAYGVAAEAGAGGPVFGLREELTRLRGEVAAEWRREVDAIKERLRKDENERARRVFVGGMRGGPVSVSVPDPLSYGQVPRIVNLGEFTAEDRRVIDEIKAGLRVEDL